MLEGVLNEKQVINILMEKTYINLIGFFVVFVVNSCVLPLLIVD